MKVLSGCAGPSKASLKAMLVNLQDSDEDSLPALQSGSVSPPAHSVPPNVGLVDIHLPDG